MENEKKKLSLLASLYSSCLQSHEQVTIMFNNNIKIGDSHNKFNFPCEKSSFNNRLYCLPDETLSGETEL